MSNETTIGQLKSMAYMGHKVVDQNGKKISYWKLREMDQNKTINVIEERVDLLHIKYTMQP